MRDPISFLAVFIAVSPISVSAFPSVRRGANPSLQLVPASSLESDGINSVKRQTSPNCASQMNPSCIQQLYGIPTGGPVVSQNVLATAGFEENANRADLGQFLQDLRPDLQPPPTFDERFIDGGVNNQDPESTSVAANVGAQYTAGLVNRNPVTFISSGLADVDGIANVANDILSQATPPTILLIPYNIDEHFIRPAEAQQICSLFQQLGGRGVSVITSSGDGGVSGLAGSPNHKYFKPIFPVPCPYMTLGGAELRACQKPLTPCPAANSLTFFRAPATRVPP